VGPGLGLGAFGQPLGGVKQGRGLHGASEEGQVGGFQPNPPRGSPSLHPDPRQ
jgi:hypothetical protein